MHYTERTPRESVKLIRVRLADPNNRYRAKDPRKPILSLASYGYEEVPDDIQACVSFLNGETYVRGSSGLFDVELVGEVVTVPEDIQVRDHYYLIHVVGQVL